MSIRRIVPNIASANPDLSREFYAGFLGMKLAMDMGRIATYVSPSNPTAQLSVVHGEDSQAAAAGPAAFSITMEVEDVDRLHGDAVARGYEIVYPLADEPWGVRRFGVVDPNGVIVNVMCHR